MTDTTRTRLQQPTAVDVARLAGVSRSAVSRAFTPGASVSPEARERIRIAAESLGYRVNFLARSLSMQRTNLVALVAADMDHSLRSVLVHRLSRRLIDHDYRPFLLPWSADVEIGRLTDMMLHYNVSGAIVTSDTPPDEIAATCDRHGVPLVLMEKPRLSDSVATIVYDHELAGRLAAEALCRAGCRRVIYAGQRRQSYSIGQRKAAFERTCAALGMTIVGSFFGAAQNYEGGAEAAHSFLQAAPAAEGVHCCNDYFALGFIDEVRAHSNLKIPDDLRLVACDDIPEASWQNYGLTTVRQSQDAAAAAAIEALEMCMGKRDGEPGETKLAVELVWRATAVAQVGS